MTLRSIDLRVSDKDFSCEHIYFLHLHKTYHCSRRIGNASRGTKRKMDLRIDLGVMARSIYRVRVRQSQKSLDRRKKKGDTSKDQD